MYIEKLKNKLLCKKFSSKKYWEERYRSGGTSGAGSYGEKAKYKAEIINYIIKQYGIKSVIEFGCGDGNNLKYYNIDKYIGFDVSKTAIKNCIKTYYADEKKTFIYYEPELFKSGGLKADLTLSLEVIFHLIEDDVYQKYMYDIFRSSSDFVLIFSSNYNENYNSVEHVKHREFLRNLDKKFHLIDHITTPKNGILEELHSDFFLFKRI